MKRGEFVKFQLKKIHHIFMSPSWRDFHQDRDSFGWFEQREWRLSLDQCHFHRLRVDFVYHHRLHHI